MRDLFLGGKSGESADLDIELYDVSPQKFDEIMQSFGAQGVGKSYFVYKYKNFDVSLPRTARPARGEILRLIRLC